MGHGRSKGQQQNVEEGSPGRIPVVGSSKWTGRRASWPNAFPVADNASISASTDDYLNIDSAPRRRSRNYETYEKTLRPSNDERTTPKTTPTSYATIVKSIDTSVRPPTRCSPPPTTTAGTSTDRQPLPSPPHTLRSVENSPPSSTRIVPSPPHTLRSENVEQQPTYEILHPYFTADNSERNDEDHNNNHGFKGAHPTYNIQNCTNCPIMIYHYYNCTVNDEYDDEQLEKKRQRLRHQQQHQQQQQQQEEEEPDGNRPIYVAMRGTP